MIGVEIRRLVVFHTAVRQGHTYFRHRPTSSPAIKGTHLPTPLSLWAPHCTDGCVPVATCTWVVLRPPPCPRGEVDAAEVEFDANRCRCEEAQARLDELERRLNTVVATQGPPRPPRARERGVHNRKAPADTTVNGVMAGWQAARRRLGGVSGTAAGVVHRLTRVPTPDPR
jgi:hypothetical protein